ncbi:19018_t:CDS:2 [Cetraspora pellucida]|uniref:19018_t:CDS:1 n=1 Tax=Cetraspora pellucida TaxID=1433469 RepID=A0A9N8WTY0_9GLOM|nr:19018_t:CDS:2 [Cetraspora pellucida]
MDHHLIQESEVEVDNTNSDLLMQIRILKNSLNVLATENSKQSQIIEIKNNKIYELEYECEYLKKQIADFNLRLESLNLYKNNIEILTNEKNKLENENTYLKEQWNEWYSTQQKRITEFLNPIKMNSAFTNLDGEINLSEEMKSFSVLAQEKRQEAEIMKNESTMKKEELISVINLILILLPETQYSKYTNLKNKTKTIVLTILQEIQGLNNAEDAIDEENEDKELIDEEII